ncbi:hypothetical protein CVT26_012222 [Gymnopilus dilepis]|uniref:Uncharacterized protein n=1 Tax=Gymnopilus dilepis TaxID=231916 RepID=A0A409YQ45_9AGAR|nr:hypothetical protein CVT26_012222 [Gymnopilus dilepis]
MRYQFPPRIPLRTRSPNSPADSNHTAAAQRSSATCSVSLASVSVSGKAGSIDSTSCSVGSGSDATAMLVDSCSSSLVTASPAGQQKPNVPVPFPKRPHSLLRSTTASTSQLRAPPGDMSSVPFVGLQDADDYEDDNSTVKDIDDHRRKRTRTSAFSSTDRIRAWRSEVTLGLPPPKAEHKCKPVSLSLSDIPMFPPFVDLTPLTPLPLYKLSMNGTRSAHAHSLSMPLLSPPGSHLIRLAAEPSPKVTLAELENLILDLRSPVPMSCAVPWSLRRRAKAMDTKFQRKVYRALVHGLESKYLSRPDERRTSIGPNDALGTHSNLIVVRSLTAFPLIICAGPDDVLNPTSKQYFDLQDASLAHRLQGHLIMNGVDLHKLDIDPVESAAPEVSPDISLPPSHGAASLNSASAPSLRMDVDEEVRPDIHPPAVPAGKPASSSATVTASRPPKPALSYEQVVARLILRHFDTPRQSTKKSTLARYPRARSALATTCVTLKSY